MCFPKKIGTGYRYGIGPPFFLTFCTASQNQGCSLNRTEKRCCPFSTGRGVTRPEMEMVSAAAEAELSILLLQSESNVLMAVLILRNTVMEILKA